MSIAARALTPEALDEARRLYEHTNVPMQQIADMLDISKSTLNIRIGRWGWRRRMGRIPLHPPRAGVVPLVPAREEGMPDEPVSDELPRRDLIGRLIRQMEGEIAAVQRIVARAGLSADGGAEAERAARTISVLVRSLRELVTLDKHDPNGEADDVRDADAYRRELGETLKGVLAAGEAG